MSFVISFGSEFDRQEELYMTLKETADRCRGLLAACVENVTITHCGNVLTSSMVIALSPEREKIPGT